MGGSDLIVAVEYDLTNDKVCGCLIANIIAFFSDHI